MAKKVKVNFNAMYPALVKAHNDNNRKAIDRQRIADLGIDMLEFEQWKRDVNELRAVVFDYVVKKNTYVADDEISKARNAIFPKWKAILSAGEKNSYGTELHCTESDVEDLYKFAWGFMATTKGSVMAQASEQTFRKGIETLLGCRIAGNAILDDDKRDILDAYYKAVKSVDNCKEQLGAIDTEIKGVKLLMKPEISDDFKEYLENQIDALKRQSLTVKETQSKAESEVARLKKKATAIEADIKLAKERPIK